MTNGTGRTVIRAGRLIDGTGAAPRMNMALVVEGTKIHSVEPWREELRQGATVYEFPVETVLPGLIDAHCHLSLLGAGLHYEEEIPNSNEFMAVTAVYNAQVMLRSGVTTLRDNGARDSIMFAVREAMNRGLLVGPRMLISGRPVTTSGGHFHWCHGVADGVEEIRRQIRLLVQEGADHIKIMASGGGTAGTNPGLPSYTADELRGAVHTAHHYGRLTTAHCRATQAVANAVEAGLDCIEHAEFNEPGALIQHVHDGPDHHPSWNAEVARRLADSGTFASLTLPGSGYVAYCTLRDRKEQEGNAALSPMERTALERGEARMEERYDHVRRFLALGMLPRLVISSDAGPFDIEFGKLWQGLEVGVKGGMTTMQALQAATRVAAEACGVLDAVGTLEPGKEADILVVEANPLDDVRNLRDVVGVFKAGECVTGE
ncbi:MAG: amidohydrolase family protein [Chloroflexi bacterium]|nr:amidohydrolase family protein [Chloroflexota bacterium]